MFSSPGFPPGYQEPKIPGDLKHLCIPQNTPNLKHLVTLETPGSPNLTEAANMSHQGENFSLKSNLHQGVIVQIQNTQVQVHKN